jgi:hypothetical protein
MKTRINQSKTGQSLLVTFHEGFSTYTITIPLSYSVRFFAEGITSALQTVIQNDNAISELEKRDGELAEIQEYLLKSNRLFDDLLKKSG